MALIALLALAAPARAQIFFYPPPYQTGPASGNEAGLFIPTMVSPTPAEERANLIWNLRSGLNVAALNCQYWPLANSVRNYNEILQHHATELAAAYEGLKAYFRRTAGASWQERMDEYTTTMYQSYVVVGGQRGFCHVASDVGREALTRPKGQLFQTAQARMREMRMSLQPVGETILPTQAPVPVPPLPNLDPRCWRDDTFDVRRCPTG
ncbi:MAG: hypothetical protein H7X93_05390 [Sphingomonadaceae bacterium]|nr:hypothetical protein [Sphingomonadaceae bacterium]